MCLCLWTGKCHFYSSRVERHFTYTLAFTLHFRYPRYPLYHDYSPATRVITTKNEESCIRRQHNTDLCSQYRWYCLTKNKFDSLQPWQLLPAFQWAWNNLPAKGHEIFAAVWKGKGAHIKLYLICIFLVYFIFYETTLGGEQFIKWYFKSPQYF